MCNRSVGFAILIVVAMCLAYGTATWLPAAEEPPALNPFGPVQSERDDAVPGYVELSNGRIFVGDIYMTRDKRIKLDDESIKRQREIPLRVIKQIDGNVLREWMEKDWRFKENANDEKYFTGRSYPCREYEHVITLQDGRKIAGPLSEIIYVQRFVQDKDKPLAGGATAKPERLLLHKRDKGEPGTSLKALVYVKTIKLGEAALEEGRKKAGLATPPAATPASPAAAAKVR